MKDFPESVLIRAAGDPDAGIPESSWEITGGIDFGVFDDPKEAREDVRAAIRALFADYIAGESVTVTFADEWPDDVEPLPPLEVQP